MCYVVEVTGKCASRVVNGKMYTNLVYNVPVPLISQNLLKSFSHWKRNGVHKLLFPLLCEKRFSNDHKEVVNILSLTRNLTPTEAETVHTKLVTLLFKAVLHLQ